MTQYTYGFLVGLTLGASIATIIAMRHARRWIEEIRISVEALQAAGMQSGHALYCLAMKLSPRGHVDISKEEWESVEQIELKLIELDEGGVRLLAR
jgi:hypothetical protein